MYLHPITMALDSISVHNKCKKGNNIRTSYITSLDMLWPSNETQHLEILVVQGSLCCHNTGIQISSSPLPGCFGQIPILCLGLPLVLHCILPVDVWKFRKLEVLHNMKYNTPVDWSTLHAYYRSILHRCLLHQRELTCFVQCKRFHCCWSIACLSVPCKDGGSVILTWVSQVDHGHGGGVGHCSPTHWVRAIPDVKNVVDEICRVQSGWDSQKGGGSPGEGDTEEAHTGSKANHCTRHIWRRKGKSDREHHSHSSVWRSAEPVAQLREEEWQSIIYT